MNLLFVARSSGPGFQHSVCFASLSVTVVKTNRLFPPHGGLWRAVVGDANVDVALPVIGSHAKVCKRFSDVDVVIIHVHITVVEGTTTDLLVGHGDAFFQLRHIIQGGWWVSDVGIKFNQQFLNIGIKNHREPHHAFVGPRPSIVNKAPFAVGYRIVVPFIWNFVGLCIDGVFCHLFKVAKLERVRSPEQFPGVFLNFNKEQQGVAFGCEIEFVTLANEQLNRLSHDATVGHDPVCTFDAGHVLACCIPCLASFALREVKVHPLFQCFGAESSTNRDVVQNTLKVRAITTGPHASNEQLVARLPALKAVVGAKIAHGNGGFIVQNHPCLLAVDVEGVTLTDHHAHLNKGPGVGFDGCVGNRVSRKAVF